MKIGSFYLKVLTDVQTNKRRALHNLLGEANKQSNMISVLMDFLRCLSISVPLL